MKKKKDNYMMNGKSDDDHARLMMVIRWTEADRIEQKYENDRQARIYERIVENSRQQVFYRHTNRH